MSGGNVTHIGWLGLGQMGAPMAERLLGEGIQLHVFDPRAEAVAPFVARGAIAHGSAKAVADAAGIVLACLPAGAVSEAAALGPEGVVHGSAIRIHAEMSTIGRPTVRRIAEGLGARGIAMVDSPITGGPAGARAGTLAIMVAGAPEAVGTLRPVLERIGRRVVAMGEEAGAAQVMKLVNNLLFAASMVAVFEAFAMGAKAGLDPAAMAEVVNAGTGRSFVTAEVLPAVLARRFDFGAALAVVDKDVRLGLAEAEALGVPMWALEQVGRVWRFAAAQGMAAEDITALARLMEGWAGAEIRGGD